MSEISFINLDASKLNPCDKEICRYLNMHACNDEAPSLISDCKKEVSEVARPKAVYIKVTVTEVDVGVCLGFGNVYSRSLAKNLSGCAEAYVFCATLGQGVDRLINKYSKIEPSKGLVCDAVATAMIEEFCDYVNGLLGECHSLRPRFSCGYGDFAIEHQESILNLLEAKKRLGVAMLDSYMMTPFKTVTAVVGIA